MEYRVKVIPKSKKNEVIESSPGILEVKLKAKPLRNQANQSLILMLAEFFHIEPQKIHILTGHHSRSKRISLS